MLISSRIALSALLCLGAASAQASPMPASASTDLSQLQFRLIDLAPDDGIAPTVSIDGYMHGLVSANGEVAHAYSKLNPLLPADSKVINGADGFSFAKISPKRLSTEAAFAGAFMPPQGSDVTVPGAILLSARESKIEYHPDDAIFGVPWAMVTLSPHTQLVLEGKAQMKTFAHAGAAASTDRFDDVTLPWTHTVDSLTNAYIGFNPGEGSTGLEGTHWKQQLHSSDSFSEGQHGDNGAKVNNFNRDFSVTLINHSDVSQVGSLTLSMQSSYSATLQISAVPEPSAAWLTLAGVALIGFKARRHR